MIRNRPLHLVLASCVVFLALCALAAPIQAESEPQGHLYLVLADEDREPDDPVAIGVLSVNESGQLEPVGTYETGEYSCAMEAPPTPAIDGLRERLFVPHNVSDGVSVLAIQDGGSLADVPDSPFPAGGGATITALHPSGEFLYVVPWKEGTIEVYGVAGAGELTLVQIVPSVFATDVEASPDGEFLFSAGLLTGVRAYHVSGDGTLAEVTGSPFTYPAMIRSYDVELSSDGSRLFLLDLDAGIVVFDVQDSGALSLVPGSPFPVGGFSYSFALTSDDRHVYASSGGAIHGFAVLADGTLAQLPDSPFFEDVYAWALLNPPGTPWLFVGNLAWESVWTYAIAPDGTLAEAGAPVFVSDPFGRVPRGMAFYRPAVRQVAIDVKPGNETNPVNPRSHGVTPVALLGSPEFDVTQVDVTTLRFGPGEAVPAHDLTDGWPYREHLRDVNLDGFTDLLAHFDTQETGIECGDTEAALTGQFLDGSPFVGADSVRTVGCSHKAKSQQGRD